MDRSGLIELRKLFNYKEGDMAFGNFSGCFINTKKEIKGKFNEQFLKNDSTTIHKFLDIYRKVFSNDSVDVSFDEKDRKDGGFQYLADKLQGTELKNDAVNEILYEKIRDALPENNYVVTAVYGTYDIPVKTKDKLKIDDAGAEVLKYIVCSVCPVKTQQGSLGYLPEKDLIGENAQQLIIDKPVFGFMYPSFNDRAADTDNVLCFRSKELDISEGLFSHKAPDCVAPARKTSKPKKEVSVQETAHDGITISNGAKPAQKASDVPSLDTGSLNNDAHYVAERTINDDEEPRVKVAEPTKEEVISSQSRKNKRVRILGNTAGISKKKIDGIECYVIPVNEAELN